MASASSTAPQPAPRRRRSRFATVTWLVIAAGLLVWTYRPTPRVDATPAASPTRILAWNDLGMHCIDPDFSVFAILPPFNTVNAQVIIDDQLQQQAGGITVTYEGVADPTGSINTTSIGKTNFWDHVEALFGTALPLDVGLTGNAMPGPGNVPQPTAFDDVWDWFQGEGIPITPFDDAFAENPYPLMQITARDASGRVIANTVTTVPNSQELECSLCHASGAHPLARPSSGWVFDPDPLADDRWNILALHDERELGNPTFTAALATAGYDAAGLFATAASGTSILCARCHGSNALPGTGIAGVPPLTQAIHGRHSSVQNPSGTALDDIPTRNACFTCHPGFETQCFRGAMGRAIGNDGQFSMHCQSCHGNLTAVADPGRIAWFEEPNCQSCHTGTATQHSGQIRFTSVFDATGQERVPASQIFATTPDVPSAGFSLYRFSTGHGGLQCSACHGPPHAIYPTSFDNDNLQSQLVQGHVGTITDCTVCHDKREDDELDGPHGMHPVDFEWVKNQHGDEAEHGGTAKCMACHGTQLDGTVLSYAQGDRSYAIGSGFGTASFFRGARVGCFHCHDGPDSEDPTNNRPPVVPNLTPTTPNDVPLPIQLTGTDPDRNPLTFRIIEQPKHGSVGLIGTTATYFPAAGFVGPDAFTYAAWDGKTNSNLGTVTVAVAPPACAGGVEAYGFGCPGSGGFLPLFSADGCPTPGDRITLSLDRGPGGSVAVLAIGLTRTALELQDGCMLRVAPLLAFSAPIPLSGTGAGNGAFSINVRLPAGAATGAVTLQALVADPATSRGWTTSNGVEITIR